MFGAVYAPDGRATIGARASGVRARVTSSSLDAQLFKMRIEDMQDQVASVAKTELSINVLEMCTNGPRLNRQTSTDRGDVEIIEHTADDLTLATGECKAVASGIHS